MLIEIEKLLDERKIFRFLNQDGLLKTLGIQKNAGHLKPTFMLRSLEHYRELEGRAGDCREKERICDKDGTVISDFEINPVLVSCWSLYDANDLRNKQTWDIFSEQDNGEKTPPVAVIQSTVGSIKHFFESLVILPEEKCSHFGKPGAIAGGCFYHGQIRYYNEKLDPFDRGIWQQKNCFFKRAIPYAEEKEYRFAIILNCSTSFSPEIYCIRLKTANYIESIYINEKYIGSQTLALVRENYANIELISPL